MARILQIEDDPNDTFFVGRILRDAGHDTHHVTTLHEGLAWIRSNPVDLILLDLQLRDTGEYEGLSRITTDHPGLPVIVLSGYAPPELHAALARLGARGTVAKGVQYPRLELLMLIDEVLMLRG